MPNKEYQRGRRKEYTICERLKKEGYDIVQRTAGSHSPIDIIAIKRETREILFVQSKPNGMSQAQKRIILNENNWMNAAFFARFEVQ